MKHYHVTLALNNIFQYYLFLSRVTRRLLCDPCFLFINLRFQKRFFIAYGPLQSYIKVNKKATGKDIIDRFKDAGRLGKGFTKALGPLGAGLSYYSNYHDAQAGRKRSRCCIDISLFTYIDDTIKSLST